MVNPVLKKLSRPGLSNNDIADLLEKHVGGAPSDAHCYQALAALNRIRPSEAVILARVAATMLSTGRDDYCQMLRLAAEQIRNAPDQSNNDG